MKIVINRCYGGFSVSPKALARYAELKGWHGMMMYSVFDPAADSYVLVPYYEGRTGMSFFVREDGETISCHDLQDDDRADPILVQIVEELGPAANGEYAKLKVVEIPDGIEYTIEEYDGNEWIAERHRTWS